MPANHPDYLVLLYACARLGAMLVPLNWRLAVPEQVYILRNAAVKALLVEQAFAAIAGRCSKALPGACTSSDRFCSPGRANALAALLLPRSGDGRNPT